MGAVRDVRSRWTGAGAAVDLVVEVEAHLPTRDAHDISERVEALLSTSASASKTSRCTWSPDTEPGHLEALAAHASRLASSRPAGRPM